MMIFNLRNIVFSICIILNVPIFITVAIANSTYLTKKQYKELKKQFVFNHERAVAITNGQKSMPYSLKALEFAMALNNEFYIAQSYNEISHDYEHIGDLSKALRYVIMAANKYEKIGKSEETGMVYNRIGSIYLRQGNNNLAISYMNKAMAVHIKMHAYSSYANDLNNLGEIYRLGKQYGKALQNFTEANNFFLKDNDSINYAYVSGNIGLVYAAQQQMDSANYYLSIATSILKKKGDYYPITVYLTETANIYFKQGNTSMALEKAIEALNISTREHLTEQLRDVNMLLTNIYAQKNDYKKAFEALQEYSRFKDSISNSKIVADMAEMRADYEVSKKETEIKDLQTVNTLRNRINIMLGTSFIIVALLTIFLFRLNKKIKLANNLLSTQKTELQQKNEVINTSLIEKETLLKEIHHRVKNNLQIISSLLSLQSQNVKNKIALEAFSESQRRLHSIALVHQKLYQNENLAKINIKEYIGDLVETIHQSFYSKGKSICYDLNIAEVNLDVDTAIPLGLIINELVTNAYKYAFNLANEGNLAISLINKDANSYKLIVKDNGPGLPENLDINETESLGLKLVSILSRQLEGTFEAKSNQGAEFSLDFVDVIQTKI